MQAKDVMTAPVVSVAPDATVREIARLLLKRGISAVPVLDADGQLAGIVSEGDLVRRPESGTERRPSWWLGLFDDENKEARDYAKSHGMRAADVMTRDVVSVDEHATLASIATLLEKRHIKRVPVMRDGKVVGIVSRANLLQGLAAHPPAAPAALDDEALRARGRGSPRGVFADGTGDDVGGIAKRVAAALLGIEGTLLPQWSVIPGLTVAVAPLERRPDVRRRPA